MKKTITTILLTFTTSLMAQTYDFKSMDQEKLLKICNETCGSTYATRAEIRGFYQLRKYPDVINQAGLLCISALEWSTQGTPCHKRKFYDGIHMDGLAPTKTEVHRGSWATEKGGAWCIAYNEEDFKGMSKAIKKGLFKPGQVACMSGMKLGSF
jgi:hypothetical protein